MMSGNDQNESIEKSINGKYSPFRQISKLHRFECLLASCCLETILIFAITLSRNKKHIKSFIKLVLSLVDMSNASNPAPTRKKAKKTAKKNVQPSMNNTANHNLSYEHHLELNKWLDNTSKMNFEYNNLDGNWPLMNAPNAFQQQTSNRKYNSHLQPFASNDPTSVPSQMVSQEPAVC